MRPGCKLSVRGDVARRDSWGCVMFSCGCCNLPVQENRALALGSPQKEGAGGHGVWAGAAGMDTRS